MSVDTAYTPFYTPIYHSGGDRIHSPADTPASSFTSGGGDFGGGGASSSFDSGSGGGGGE